MNHSLVEEGVDVSESGLGGGIPYRKTYNPLSPIL